MENAYCALEVFLNVMRYINPRFTYLLTYLLGLVTVTVTELRSSTMFSEESCSVGLSEKMGFQLRSELLATVVR